MTDEECEIETGKAIMKMRNHIAELKKENELAKSLLYCAKRLLKSIVDTPMYNQMGGEAYENEEYKELLAEAEQFLKEIE